MNKLKHILPIFLIWLTGSITFQAVAYDGFRYNGFVTTDKEVLNNQPAGTDVLMNWDTRIELNNNGKDGSTFFGWEIKNEEYKAKASSVDVTGILKKGDETLENFTIKNNGATQNSDWGQWNYNGFSAGTFSETFTMTVKFNDGTPDETFVFGPFDFTIQELESVAISDPTYTYVNATTLKASVKVSYTNPGNVPIKGIRVGAVGNTPVEGETYLRDWNKENSNDGDIVWGSIMLPADHPVGEQTVEFELSKLPADRNDINAWFKAYIIPSEGNNVEGNTIHSILSTVDTTPALAISDANCVYKDATSVTATINLDVRNITGNIRVAALSADENLGSGIWNQDDKPYKILAEKTITAAEAANPVEFDITGLPGSTPNIPVIFSALYSENGTDVYATLYNTKASTVETISGMVNTVYSESYNVAPYTNGISYTAANIENGEVKWTFPSWATEYTEEGATVTAANGISGRWVKIEKSAVENAEFFAPLITYTISNDVDGYMYFSMTINSDNIPDGLNPQFWANNNRNVEDATMTVVEGTDNKQWTWKSHYQYPNNHTVSYQLYLSSSVGNAATRVFGYEVLGATDGRVKQPANVELEEVARNAEIYQGKNISAQIYFLPAYDAYSAPQDDFKDKPIPVGTWSYTRCPSDFANLNTEAFHFSPEIIYFLSNAVEDNQENKPSKLYFSFQLGKSYGIVDGEEREIPTIIPNDYVPQLIVYVPKENTAATANAGLRANETVWEEYEVTNMSQVRNYLNTYEVTSTKEYAANSNIKVGIKHTFTSIMGGNGYSVMEPRGYVMSSDDEVITGIEEVASEAEAVAAVATVYNLQGMAVRVNVATENALEGLPAGIYIVNGKKYAVR